MQREGKREGEMDRGRERKEGERGNGTEGGRKRKEGERGNDTEGGREETEGQRLAKWVREGIDYRERKRGRERKIRD